MQMKITKGRKKKAAWRNSNNGIVACIRNKRTGKRSRSMLKMSDVTGSVDSWETRLLGVDDPKKEMTFRTCLASNRDISIYLTVVLYGRSLLGRASSRRE